jgi:hypothetical protein
MVGWFNMNRSPEASTGFLLMFYGLYYGVLGRDFATWVTTRMYNTFPLPCLYLTHMTCMLISMCDTVHQALAIMLAKTIWLPNGFYYTLCVHLNLI